MSKKNATVIKTDSAIVLYSYSTPVVVFNKQKSILYKTKQHHSSTTTKHINEFIRNGRWNNTTIKEIEQSDLNETYGTVETL